MSRRGLLNALAGLLLGGCQFRRHHQARGPQDGEDEDGGKSDFVMSTQFARLAIAYLRSPSEGLEQQLLAHPAIDVLLRHQRMKGLRSSIVRDLLHELFKDLDSDDIRRAEVAVQYWDTHVAVLANSAKRAEFYLPKGTPLRCTIYVVLGYEMGAASPPDILIDAAATRFQAPEELSYVLIHEAHHVGFLAWQRWPSLEGLFTGSIARLVRFATQMEGMAVHAAYEPRRRDLRLDSDRDYQVYVDAESAREVVRQYAMYWKQCQTILPSEEAENILERMSTGPRLWYRFGALVSATLERLHGRRSLVQAVVEPERFWGMAEQIMVRPDLAIAGVAVR